MLQDRKAKSFRKPDESRPVSVSNQCFSVLVRCNQCVHDRSTCPRAQHARAAGYARAWGLVADSAATRSTSQVHSTPSSISASMVSFEDTGLGVASLTFRMNLQGKSMARLGLSGDGVVM